MNAVWLGLLVAGAAFAAATGRLPDFTTGVFEQAKAAVELAIGLVGTMALWLGIMKVAEASGLTLIGFVRGGSMNVYTGGHRVLVGEGALR